MSEFTKAAERAADDYHFAKENREALQAVITKHFADLAATYELLCELADANHLLRDMQTTTVGDRFYHDELGRLKTRIDELLAAPLIIDAIKEGGE